MKHLKKNYNLSISGFVKHPKFYMNSTQLLKLALMLLVITNFSSCSDDDVILPAPTPEPDVRLEFNTQTRQDQMGDFADNAMVVFNGKVWSVAGDNSYTAPYEMSSDVWESDNGINWKSVTSNQFEARRGHTLTVFDNKMWLIGGITDTGTVLHDIWYSTDGSTWNNVTHSASLGDLHDHSTFVFNNKLYVISHNATSNSVWSSTNGIDWVLEQANAFPVRNYTKTVIFNDVIYVIGGLSSTIFHNEIWKSTDGINWAKVATTTPIFETRIQHTATVYNDKVWIISGREDVATIHGNVWYSTDMETWIEYEDIDRGGGLFAHVNLVFNGSLWLFGGYEAGTVAIGRIVEITEL